MNYQCIPINVSDPKVSSLYHHSKVFFIKTPNAEIVLDLYEFFLLNYKTGNIDDDYYINEDPSENTPRPLGQKKLRFL